MIVMSYAKDGSLKKSLPNIINDKWIIKLKKLVSIIRGLDIIHQQNVIHCDFHHGNILNSYSNSILSISDLGLCKPVEYFQSKFKDNIYGVLPFVAPEVLRGKPYTIASDIYSFSMIMWEFTSGVPPFDNRPHDLQLSISICKDERPEIIKNTPKCYVDLMKRCWDKDPLKRPNTSKIKKIIHSWISNICNKNINNINEDIIEFYKTDKILKTKQTNILNTSEIKDKSHPQAYHTSRLLDFTKKLNEILDQEDVDIYDYENNKNNELYKMEISQNIGNYYNAY